MGNSKTNRKSLIRWAVTLVIIAILYFTGLNTEVIGGFQRIMLSTGLIKPGTDFSGTVSHDIDIDDENYLNDMPLATIDGEKVNLRDLEGKVVFLNIWATWCPPCIAEMPNIHSLYKKTDPAKIAFVMLSIDKNQEKAKKFIERKKYEFPVYFPGGNIPSDLQADVIPTTFILDTNGNILTRHEGMADYDNNEFINYLNSISESLSAK